MAKPSEDKFSVIQVRLKEEAVIRYMSHDIYANWSSGVRELFANELTAAHVAARLGARPSPVFAHILEQDLSGVRLEIC